MSQKSVTTREWFRDAFDARYLEVYPWRDEIAAEREVCSAIDWLRAIPGERFLDLCCGAGRHSLWLKKAGLDLVSLDLSDDLLRSRFPAMFKETKGLQKRSPSNRP